ncbi:hypothetical protein RHMOL_Rhmol03G0041100 [Rhododendron molle]|uniref:Uncharacterized protein n=1 Tax=Rhododendron molle TaxID=49168 RepID=A0ACC0P9Z0_RHOML|nr:hypothetical protein RHMOL_Rhmol03G0041100 [Rhododendron molle]
MNNNSTITFRQTLFPNPQRGRCICFRTVNLKAGAYGMGGANGTVSFYSIPFDFVSDGGDDDVVNYSNPDVEGLLPFYKGTDFPISSTLSSVGSSLFVVGGSKKCMRGGPSLTTFNSYRFDTTAPADGWRAISMLTPRTSPQTACLPPEHLIKP